MVGLYHKRRAERSQSKVLRCIVRAGATAGIFTVVGFSLVAIFLNGTVIKGPLGAYLSSKTGLDVTIEDAEFSPIYPDVIKLNNVTFGSSKVGELYLEYDIRSALSEDELKINDIYINDLKLSKDDLLALAENKAGYKSIRANSLRFHHTPINTRFLKTTDATIRLNQVVFGDKDGLTFRSGSLSSEKLGLFNEQAKNFAVEFEQAPDGMRLNAFSVQMYGGTISGKGMYSQSLAHNASTSGETDTATLASEAANNILTDIKLDELNLTNVILYTGLASPENITLTSEYTTFSDVILTDDAPSSQNNKPASAKKTSTSTDALAAAKAAEDAAQEAAAKKDSPKDGSKADSTMDEVRLSAFIAQGINGNIEDLIITSSGIQGSFNGMADEISMPNLQTTMESNKVTASFKDNVINFKLQGSVYEGSYLAQGVLDHDKKEFNLEKLLMKKAKLAINTPRLKFLSAGLSDYTFNLKHAGFEGLEFLSYLNSLPVSIQSITGTADNISIKGVAEQKDQDSFYRILDSLSVLKDDIFAQTPTDSKDTTQGDKDAANDKLSKEMAAESIAGAAMELEFKNFLYSDLLVSRMHSKWSLDENRLLIEVPVAKFKESQAAAEAKIAIKAFEPSSLKVNAPNFETADLNSNLINHMLTGKVTFRLAIESKAQAKTFESLKNEAKGRMSLNSKAMLISDLGLDLINGGKNQSYDLSYTELLNGVQGSVAGISNLRSTTTFNNGVAKNTTTMGLSTADLRATVNADYERNSITGSATFISPAKDSSTRVTISGVLDDPRFKITPIRRGAQRPGLYLPQYDTTAKAKEQTDAAAVLNGKVQIEEPTKDITAPAPLDETAPAKDPEATADQQQAQETKPAANKNTEPQQEATPEQNTTAPKQEKTTDQDATDNDDNKQDILALGDQSKDKTQSATDEVNAHESDAQNNTKEITNSTETKQPQPPSDHTDATDDKKATEQVDTATRDPQLAANDSSTTDKDAAEPPTTANAPLADISQTSSASSNNTTTASNTNTVSSGDPTEELTNKTAAEGSQDSALKLGNTNNQGNPADKAKASTTSHVTDNAATTNINSSEVTTSANTNASEASDHEKATTDAITPQQQAAADKTESELLKNVLIDSLFDGGNGEEELIF